MKPLPHIICNTAVTPLALFAMTILLIPAAHGAPEETDAKPRKEPDRIHAIPDEQPLGRWRVAPAARDEDLSAEQLEMVEQLEALGYAAGTTLAKDSYGVTAFNEQSAHPGLNLYTSGHAAEALLMDMKGNVVHRWYCEFAKVWPKRNAEFQREGSASFRRAKVLPNGDLIAIYEGAGIIKLDRDSNLVWSNSILAHHDLEIMPNGEIYTLSRVAHMLPRLDEEHPILEDFVSILTPEGRERKRISLIECFENSDYAHIVSRRNKQYGDIFHTNTLEVLDGRIADQAPAFQDGRILTSLLVPSVIAVIDIDARTVPWIHRGDYRQQHDPQILTNGNMLLFDNRGSYPHSVVMEMAPPTWETMWEYRGSERTPFYTRTCGSAQRFPNGNTLIVESDNGRAFEVTPAKEIVWEYVSPHRAGDQNELVATLFDLYRLPAEYFADEWPEIAQSR